MGCYSQCSHIFFTSLNIIMILTILIILIIIILIIMMMIPTWELDKPSALPQLVLGKARIVALEQFDQIISFLKFFNLYQIILFVKFCNSLSDNFIHKIEQFDQIILFIKSCNFLTRYVHSSNLAIFDQIILFIKFCIFFTR